MTRAFIYLRVSGKGQVDGDGFDRQLIACKEYAAHHGIEVIEVFREEGVSGTTELDERPALSELFAALEENSVKVVIIEKLDRLARDLLIQETIVADMLRKGYTLLSTTEPDLLSTDPSRVLVRQVFGAIAQYDRAMLVLKLRGARQRIKKKHGRCEGVKPFGDKLEEKAAMDAITSLSTVYHFTPRAIANYLNEHSLKSRSGKPWHWASVAKIVRRITAQPSSASSSSEVAALPKEIETTSDSRPELERTARYLSSIDHDAPQYS